jgi:5-enolpyruvylshikimate-3-phosphate synthase
MINLRPARSVLGKVELPVSPDLLFMAALCACAASREIKISGVGESDVINDIIRSLSSHASIDLSDSILQISPRTDDDDPAILLTLPESLLPYRMIYLFIGLGMGKTVAARSMSQKQSDDFIAQAKRIGITVEAVEIDQATGLKSTRFDSDLAEKSYPNEDDCAALLAFLLGKGEKLTFTITDYHLSTPLRQLAPAFGFTFNAKLNTAGNDDDPIAKRMRFLKSKQRENQEQSLTYTVDVNFSAKSSDNSDAKNGHSALNITIPGDEILAAALVTLKCLIPKGDLEITNAPLESWALQTISFIKKMGGKISMKENAKTAFGSCGAITVQKSEYIGRKTRCVPLYQYIGQLPCMTVAAAFAESKSVFRELEALRLCEPDGLDQLEKSLRPLGARHGEMPDGIVVEGAKDFDGFDIPEPLPAHVAIAFCVAGLKCMGKTSIADDRILARWPDFEKTINEICEFRNR